MGELLTGRSETELANGLDVGEREPWEDFHMCCMSSPRVGAGTKVMKRSFTSTQRAVLSKTSRLGAALPVGAQLCRDPASSDIKRFLSLSLRADAKSREHGAMIWKHRLLWGRAEGKVEPEPFVGWKSFLFPFILLGPWMGLNNETCEQKKSI